MDVVKDLSYDASAPDGVAMFPLTNLHLSHVPIIWDDFLSVSCHFYCGEFQFYIYVLPLGKKVGNVHIWFPFALLNLPVLRNFVTTSRLRLMFLRELQ